jgi:DNA-binding GntR family transcriptional regulator
MTQRAQAYDAFTRHLLERKLRPGQFVTQRELAELTGMKLGAIREMIPRLEAEGLLRAIPQRGLQVADLDLRTVRDAFALRALIELEAVSQFVAAAPDAAITAQADALEQVIAASAGGATEALLAQAQSVDWGFHDALVDGLHNRLIADIHRVNAIRIRLITYERVTLSPDSLRPALAEHQAIVAALCRRDAPAAVAALAAHLDHAQRRALGVEHAPLQAPARAVLGRL